MKRRPPRLHKGDTVGIIAPSSPPNIERLTKALDFLDELGLHYVLGNTVQLHNHYLAGTDQERAQDLQEMIEDPTIKAIFCASAGFGAARIADKIDYLLLEENPKIFWGFSDITFLHTAIGMFSDIVTFHGPTLSSIGRENVMERTKHMFEQLFQPAEIHYDESISPLTTICGGAARGEITGGNLTLIANSLGTKFEIDTAGKILLIEDIGLEPAQIDGLLNQLRQARKFEQVKGIVIGEFTEIHPREYEDSPSLDELFESYFKDLNIPVVSGFKIGHCEPNVGIPLGVDVLLDAENKDLAILPGVE
ncbi:LD-carboxypeptidase [Rummeliibacillus sp. POC4]|uniref:S66 peptidase family protein n=1 Tax=Rummeliibacillus sp. POC4 TaxID=2305899 RepID=UPI000E66C1C2|nr:LD-carboxypeptidase [Rummeliibacillus sp. POC4]RIJ67867.1 LD-carboxypeptidase [Rummeliibacillus sp. POC4]